MILTWGQVAQSALSKPLILIPKAINESDLNFKAPPFVRVRVAKGKSNISLEGMNLKRKIHNRSAHRFYSGKKNFKFRCYGQKKKISKKPLLFASLSSNNGFLKVDGKKYSGRVDILTNPDGTACDVVNVTSLEKYISSLLSKEMNASWPIEALKAQAVAARTYALHKIKSQQVSKVLGHEAHYDLESSEKHQVSGSLEDSTRRTILATKQTRGQILTTKSGDLVPIFFHAQCGGRTHQPQYVWENNVTGYESRNCPTCKKERKGSWNKKIKIKRFKKFLSWLHKNKYLPVSLKELGKDFTIAPDKIEDRNLKLYFKEDLVIIAKPLLRRYFGRFLFPSNNFEIDETKGGRSIKVEGRGNGHGVGLCQTGALRTAQNGKSYKQILKKYFPEHNLISVYQ